MEKDLTETGAESTSPAPSKPRGRAWWQWVLGIGLLAFFAVGQFLKWLERNHPDIVLSWSAADTIPLDLPEGIRDVETVPAKPGEYAGYNLLLITLDTTRADRLGFYGNHDIETPNLDSLARQGVIFSRTFAPNPTTLPSHSTIHTGLFPYHHGARKNGATRLKDSVDTLAEILSRRSYHTAAFVSTIVLNAHYGLNQGFEEYRDEVEEAPDTAFRKVAERRGDKTTDLALEWLSSHPTGPFFVWTHYYDAHAPYEPPPPFDETYDSDRYAGEIAFVDTQIGRLLDALRKQGRYEKTLIVVIGDHGEGLGQHREWTHGLMVYDTTLHVPFLMHCGGRLGGGVHIGRPVGSVDVAPTVLSMLGVPVEHPMDGVDLTQPWDESRPLFADTLEGFEQFAIAPLLSVRRAEQKYIYGPDPELYAIDTDPDEEHDLIDRQPEAGQTMKQLLSRLYGDDLRKAGFIVADQSIGAEERAKLAALGYVSAGLSEAQASAELPDPKAVMPLINKLESAMMGEESRDRSVAIARFEELAVEHPDFYAIHKYLADMYEHEGEYYLALTATQRCLELYPNAYENLLTQARLHVELRQFDDAIKSYGTAIEHAPDKYTPLAELGRLLLNMGRMGDAADHLKAAFDMRPTDDMVALALKTAMVRSGREFQAIDLFQTRLKSDPRQARVRLALAQLKAARGDVAAAQQLIEAGIRLDPDNLRLKEGLASLWIDRAADAPDRLPEAIALMERVCLMAETDQADYLVTLSRAYAAAGNHEKAVSAAQKALDRAKLDKSRSQEARAKSWLDNLERQTSG